jgi:hypothetical protein
VPGAHVWGDASVLAVNRRRVEKERGGGGYMSYEEEDTCEQATCAQKVCTSVVYTRGRKVCGGEAGGGKCGLGLF